MKKYISQQDMKQANAAEVFRVIRKHGRLTRHELAEKTQMSWGAISNIASRLIAYQYIIEGKQKKSVGAGRTPSCLEVNGTGHFVIGLDINYSGFRAVIMNLKNEVISSWSKRIRYTDKQELLESILRFAEEAIGRADGHHILGIGIAMQGQVDAKNGISIQFPHCHNWKNIPIVEILERELGIPVVLEHDPNCILNGEAIQAELKRAILIRVDNGIGLAVMLDGKIMDGKGMFEIGHTCVVPNGLQCSCGKRGCLECYASQRGMESIAGRSFEELVEAARHKEQIAVRMFCDMADYLAFSIANTVQLLNIPNVLICGDMLQYQDLFYERLCQKTEQMLQPAYTVEFACADVENASLGAALIAIDYSIETMMTGGL